MVIVFGRLGCHLVLYFADPRFVASLPNVSSPTRGSLAQLAVAQEHLVRTRSFSPRSLLGGPRPVLEAAVGPTPALGKRGAPRAHCSSA